MPKQRPPKKSDTTNVVGAGAAGGGIGTIIATLADSMPDDAAYKSILTVASPLIAVGISGLWLFIKTVYIDPFTTKKKHGTADAAMDKVLNDARDNASKVLSDPNSTKKHKEEVRKIVEDLELLRLEKITERMEVVATD